MAKESETRTKGEEIEEIEEDEISQKNAVKLLRETADEIEKKEDLRAFIYIAYTSDEDCPTCEERHTGICANSLACNPSQRMLVAALDTVLDRLARQTHPLLLDAANLIKRAQRNMGMECLSERMNQLLEKVKSGKIKVEGLTSKLDKGGEQPDAGGGQLSQEAEAGPQQADDPPTEEQPHDVQTPQEETQGS